MQEGQYKELQQKEQSLKQQMRELQASIGENQGQMSEKIRRHENLSGANEQRRLQLEEMLQGYVPNEEISQEVQEQLKKRSGQSLKNQKTQNLRLFRQESRRRRRHCALPETVTFLLIRPVSLTVQKSPMKPMRSFWKNIRRTTSRRMKRNLRNSVILSIRVCGRM